MNSLGNSALRWMRPPMAALAASILVLVLTACSGGEVRGQPPLVGVSSLAVTEQGFLARVDIHNPNGVDMRVSRIGISMTVGDDDIGRHSSQPGINIHPNGVEVFGFDFPPNDPARETLSRLERGDLNGVPYSISGEVIDGEGKPGKFTQQGYLYPVPGRPGQFRGAGPQRDTRPERQN